MLIRSSIHALKMDTEQDTRHVIDLELQFPEGQSTTQAPELSFSACTLRIQMVFVAGNEDHLTVIPIWKVSDASHLSAIVDGCDIPRHFRPAPVGD